MNRMIDDLLNEMKNEKKTSKKIELFKICKNRIYNTKELSYKEKVDYLNKLEMFAVSINIPI